jgi:hypothetical protein
MADKTINELATASALSGTDFVPIAQGSNALVKATLADLSAFASSGGLADGSVTESKIGEGAVTGTKLGNESVTFPKVAAAAIATVSEWLSNTASKLLSVRTIWDAASPVALTDAATIAVDMNTGMNFTVTLGGNRTLGNPTNAKPGQTGVIYVIQDGTGGRTLAFGANYKFAGGTAFSIDTAANRVSALSYHCRTATDVTVSGAAGVR